jgi:hypothetical protein
MWHAFTRSVLRHTAKFIRISWPANFKFVFLSVKVKLVTFQQSSRTGVCALLLEQVGLYAFLLDQAVKPSAEYTCDTRKERASQFIAHACDKLFSGSLPRSSSYVTLKSP